MYIFYKNLKYKWNNKFNNSVLLQPMETETVEERTNSETTLGDDTEESPKTYRGHEAAIPVVNLCSHVEINIMGKKNKNIKNGLF